MKRFIHFFIFLLITATFSFIACQKENRLDCFKRTGKITKIERKLIPFSNISIEENKINVFIKQDTFFKIEIEGGENLVDLITTDVINDTLWIDDHNRCNFSRSYKPQINVYITLPSITNIRHYGTGKLESLNTIKSNFIRLFTMGPSDIKLDLDVTDLFTHLHKTTYLELNGNITNCYHYLKHNSTLNAENASCANLWIASVTTGNSYLKANGSLTILLEANGDVYYKGTPTSINTSITGTGKIIAH